jgi:sulfoxide reductase catalytic subunit YedY
MAGPSEEPPGASPLGASASFRDQLTAGEDVIDPATFAGSIPAVNGVAPRIRIGRDRWFNLLWLIPIGFATAMVLVAIAQALRDTTAVSSFIQRHPGVDITPQVERDAGLPAWVGVQHFLNLFLMIFILRSGIQILTDHPRLYWTRHSTPGKDWFRIQKPVPSDPLWTAKKDSISLPRQLGLPGLRHSIGLARWWHLGVDVLWLANGLVFYVLIFATGHWRRIVPTSWDVLPNALSTLITMPTSAAGTVATTRTTSSSGIGSPSSVKKGLHEHLPHRTCSRTARAGGRSIKRP